MTLCFPYSTAINSIPNSGSNLSMKYLILVATVLFPSQLFADSGIAVTEVEKRLQASINKVHIVFDDDVDGGCLPRPSRAVEEAELVLRNSGFEITNTSDYDAILYINFLGYDIGAVNCVTTVSITIGHPIHSNNTYLFTHEMVVGRILLAFDKKRMQDQIESFVEDATKKLVLDIKRNKDSN